MSNKQKDKEFKILMTHIKKMQSRYFHALCAFYAYEALREVAASNIVGKSEASENVRTMDRYKNFFVPTQEALQRHFLLELGKLFDASDQSLHINKIVTFTEGNLKHLTVDTFQEYNQDQNRKFLSELVKRYKGVAHSDLANIKSMLEKQRDTIEKLKTYRDKWLAHDDLKKPKRPGISALEVKGLFDILQKILNTISGKLNNETWLYRHVEGDVKRHVRLVIDHLRRFEPYRLKEIDAGVKRKYEALRKAK